jgi:class 3 adenylate cyclase
MPIFMDRHYIEGATRHTVARAHEMDLEIQEKHRVKFLTYWFDDARNTAFCLVEAPNKESIQSAHDESHGLVPHEILEVDPTIVEAFLGRVKDPTPVDTSANQPTEDLIDAGFRAIMFTDLKDSTLMTTTFGDSRALHLLHVHNVLVRNALRENGGREVKHTGDGIMASFGVIPDSVRCAMAIQQAFNSYNAEHPDDVLYVRVGLGAGEPVEEYGDLFGKAVQMAARVCDHAEPGTILAADVVRDACPDHNEWFVDAGEFTPKGFTEPVSVFKVSWIRD